MRVFELNSTLVLLEARRLGCSGLESSINVDGRGHNLSDAQLIGFKSGSPERRAQHEKRTEPRVQRVHFTILARALESIKYFKTAVETGLWRKLLNLVCDEDISSRCLCQVMWELTLRRSISLLLGFEMSSWEKTRNGAKQSPDWKFECIWRFSVPKETRIRRKKICLCWKSH